MTAEYTLDCLEPRTHLSAATLSRHGVLYVVGSRHADNIVIYTDRRRRRQVVNVYVNHHLQTFAASRIRSVIVQAGGGNDRVTFTDHRGRVPGRHFLYGGAGADCLIDDAGSDYIDTGGDANDTVYGGGGDDEIIGSPIVTGEDESGGGGGGDLGISGSDGGNAGSSGGDDFSSGGSSGGDFGNSGGGATTQPTSGGGGGGNSESGGSSDSGAGSTSGGGSSDDGGSSDSGGSGGDDFSGGGSSGGDFVVLPHHFR